MSDYAAVNREVQTYVGRELSACEADIRRCFPQFILSAVPADAMMTCEFEDNRIRAGIAAGRIEWIRVG